jgi:hypothetical protein
MKKMTAGTARRLAILGMIETKYLAHKIVVIINEQKISPRNRVVRSALWEYG